MALTDTELRNLKPSTKDVFKADGSGLYIRVTKSGTKTFVKRTRVGGTARWVTLGDYPALSLKDARILAQRTDKTDKTPLKDLYDNWMARSIRRDYKSPDQVRYRMDLHIIPQFGHRAVADITRAEIANHLAALADKAPIQANRVLGDVKLMFNYAVQTGLLDASPIAILTAKTVGGREKSRARTLTDDEIRALVAELRKDRFQPATRYALALLLLTGQRSGEVRKLQANQINGSWWVIPVDNTKTGVQQKVSVRYFIANLSRLAFKELGNVPFDGMEGQTLARAVKRMGVTWTPHDLRRTMATKMADNGVAPHVIEKCLNHTLGGVMAIYNRSEYLAEKAAAWRVWQRALIRILKEKAPD